MSDEPATELARSREELQASRLLHERAFDAQAEETSETLELAALVVDAVERWLSIRP